MNKRVGVESADAVLVGRECERYVEEDATGGLEYDENLPWCTQQRASRCRRCMAREMAGDVYSVSLSR